jgi:hypothetical protein
MSITTMGLYWCKCESTLAAETVVSNLVYFIVTNGTDALHERLITGIKSRVQGLLLSGIANGSIYDRKVITDRDVTKPAVIVSPEGIETDLAGRNESDDWGYPVSLMIVAADNQTLATSRATYLEWRRRIKKAMHNQRLPGVTEIHRMIVEPLTIVDPQYWLANLWVSGMVIRCVCRETRGVSA